RYAKSSCWHVHGVVSAGRSRCPPHVALFHEPTPVCPTGACNEYWLVRGCRCDRRAQTCGKFGMGSRQGRGELDGSDRTPSQQSRRSYRNRTGSATSARKAMFPVYLSSESATARASRG